jgi:hypothetical protein
MALTVLLSVLLHGLSATPLSTAYSYRVEKMVTDAPEIKGAVVAPVPRGSIPTDGPKQAHEER